MNMFHNIPEPILKRMAYLEQRDALDRRTGVPRTEQASDGARLHPAISHRDRISDVPD